MFRRFHRFAFNIPECVFPNRLGNSIIRLSTSAYVTKNKSDDPSTPKESAASQKGEERHRNDLERLKKLLFQEKSRPHPSNGNKNKHDQKQELKRGRTKTKQIERKLSPSVNVSKFKDILSALKQGNSLPAYEGITLVGKPKPPLNEKGTIKGEKITPSEDYPQKTNDSPSVDVSKIKDVLSVLGQDGSSAPSEDVVLAARHKQLSYESLPAFEGEYNIKTRQIRDKNSKAKMPRNSLRTGARFHWFDDVKTKWSEEQSITIPTLFHEMAEKEIKDLGMSTSAQSGYQDLIENVNRQWAFPVDNEACKNEEENVGFDEHVFLEYLLDEYPKSGNISEFMELVITGLQQNPHLSIQEKKEHIAWFKEYFENIPDEHVQV